VALAAALSLAAVQAALLALTAWDKSDTADEPSYIVGGMFQWVRGDYLENCHAPPLPRLAYAAALRVVDPDLFTVWRETNRWNAPHPLFTRSAPDLRRNLFATRLTTVCVTVAGGLFLWHAAFLAFGWPAALVTHILWCFSPSLLAHGSLATLDAWATGMLCVAIWCTVRLWQAPTSLRWLALGIALGLAGGSKVTSLVFAPVAIGVGLLARRRQSDPSNARPIVGLAVALLGFAAVLWTLYGFGVGIVNAAAPCNTTRGVWNLRIGPVPFPLWFEGMLLQYRRGKVGFQNYLLGEVKRTGWWWFYVVVLALKMTIGAQLLALLALVMRRWSRLPGGPLVDVAILLCPIALFIAMSAGETQGGVRYILPAFPFAMLWAGRVVGALTGRVRILAGVLLAAAIAESLAVHPHYLMFFNQWIGGPRNGPFYLIQGDDWGQDQRRLAEWQHDNKVHRLLYSYYVGQPEAWGIVYRQAPCEPKQAGRYALHATEVHRPKRVPPGCFDWLTVDPPDDRIGWSIYLYNVPPARLKRLKELPPPAHPFWRSGPPR
jgi:dolichyl-phosphate-mannose-protein mannosyltransferase